MLGVCLSVCLSVATLRKNYTQRIFVKILPQMSVNKEELIKLLKVTHFRIRIQDVLKDSSTMRDRAFFTQFGSYLWTY